MRLTKKEFRAWLETNGGLVVGQIHCPCECPVAVFAKLCGYTNIFIGEAGTIKLNGKWIKTPRWIQRFTDKVDKIDKRIRGVRGATALRILDSI